MKLAGMKQRERALKVVEKRVRVVVGKEVEERVRVPACLLCYLCFLLLSLMLSAKRLQLEQLLT